MSVEISITDQIVEINETSTPVEISVAAGAATAAVWGNITGTLSNQTDLQNALNAKFDDPTGTTAQYLRGDGTLATFPTITSGTVTSVGLTMPTAFTVANSPITSSGTLAVTGAGTASQYIRGDGQLSNFPDNQGGGSSVNYYLNGSVTQGTFGGDTYYEMSKTPVLGAGTNFTRTNAQGNGYIASFITDAGDPSLLNIPAGNWNVEFYFQANSNAGNPQFYAELYKVDASNNFTLVGSGSTNPEGITNGTTIDQYYTAIPVPQTSLLVTDRLAIRIFVIPSGRTITLHTENNNLCEVLTTLSTGLNALNGLTAQVQYFATGTSGTDFAISSVTDTHTFNLPTASATNRGALSSADWTTFNGKISGTGTAGQVAYFTGANTQSSDANFIFDATNDRLRLGGGADTAQRLQVTGTTLLNGSVTFSSTTGMFWDATNSKLGIGIATPAQALSIIRNENTSSGIETQNTSTGTAANSGIIVRNSATSGQLFKLSTGYTTYKTLVASDLGFYNAGAGDISLLNDFSTGKIKFTTGTSSTAQMTLTAAGRLLLGSTTEGTQRLQVTGDTIMVGSGATSATVALTISNSTPTTLIQFRNDGRISQSPLNSNSSTAFGTNALNVSTGSSNTAFGFGALQNATTAVDNAAFGREALGAITVNASGLQNTAIGSFAANNLSAGVYNVAVGHRAAGYLSGGTTAATDFSQGVYIGYQAKVSSGGPINEIVIGYLAEGVGSNTTVIGNTSTTTAYIKGKIMVDASTTARSSINIGAGSAPTSPVDGDIWFDGTNLRMRIGGVTRTFTLI
jgi:hypothetical protein